VILSEKANFSYVPYEPRQEFLEHSRDRGDLIKRRRKLDGGVIPEPLLKGTQNFMFGSIADGDDEWKPESFAVSCVQAVEPREVLAAHPVNAHTSCSAVESCVRARSRASLPASSGCALSRPIGRVVLPTRGYCASLARATSFPGPGACVQLSKIIAEARWTPARKFFASLS